MGGGGAAFIPVEVTSALSFGHSPSQGICHNVKRKSTGHIYMMHPCTQWIAGSQETCVCVCGRQPAEGLLAPHVAQASSRLLLHRHPSAFPCPASPAREMCLSCPLSLQGPRDGGDHYPGVHLNGRSSGRGKSLEFTASVQVLSAFVTWNEFWVPASACSS